LTADADRTAKRVLDFLTTYDMPVPYSCWHTVYGSWCAERLMSRFVSRP